MADTFTDGFCLKLIGLLDDKQIKIKEDLGLLLFWSFTSVKQYIVKLLSI